MEKLTYKQAFDKITEAYIKGEIQPYEAKFCFCGTLLDGDDSWCINSVTGRHKSTGRYSGFELGKMERALLDEVQRYPKINDEDALFKGMCAALEVLKDIHKSRGENVEDFQFEKRQLKELI